MPGMIILTDGEIGNRTNDDDDDDDYDNDYDNF